MIGTSDGHFPVGSSLQIILPPFSQRFGDMGFDWHSLKMVTDLLNLPLGMDRDEAIFQETQSKWTARWF